MKETFIRDARMFENGHIDAAATVDNDGHYGGDIDLMQDCNEEFILFEKKEVLAAKMSEGQRRMIKKLYSNLSLTVIEFWGYEYAPLRVTIWTPRGGPMITIENPPNDSLRRIKQTWKDAAKLWQIPDFTDLCMALQREATENLLNSR